MTDGTLTLSDALFQETYISVHTGNTSKDYNSRPMGPDFHAELFPVHSPLLRESHLVSFPALTYMLKFSAWSCLTSCLGVEGVKPPGTTGTGSSTRNKETAKRSTMLVCSDDSDILNASALIQH